MHLVKDCKYYPCHDNLETCFFCYCPLYNIGNCGGDYSYTDSGKKDCSVCEKPHTKKGCQDVMAFIEDITNKKLKTDYRPAFPGAAFADMLTRLEKK